MKEKVTEPTELESTDCGVVGREGATLDVTGVGDEGSAVKLKSFTVVTFRFVQNVVHYR